MGSVTALTTSYQDVSSVGPKRRISLIGSSDCVVAFESYNASGGSTAGVRIKRPLPPSVVDAPQLEQPNPATDLILRGPQMASPVFDDATTFLRYVLLAGTVTNCWVEGIFPGAAQAGAATASVLGTVEMSIAPAVAATPIAVGNNDTRVTTVEVPITLSGSDGSLAETIVWRAPVGCTVASALIASSVAMTANNTDYDTFTLQNRPLAAPGTPAVLIATTTKGADLNGLAIWVEKSLGTLANTTLLAGDQLCFKSVASGAGKASGPALLRITYTVP
jgi:hypothetical protein